MLKPWEACPCLNGDGGRVDTDGVNGRQGGKTGMGGGKEPGGEEAGRWHCGRRVK